MYECTPHERVKETLFIENNRSIVASRRKFRRKYPIIQYLTDTQFTFHMHQQEGTTAGRPRYNF